MCAQVFGLVIDDRTGGTVTGPDVSTGVAIWPEIDEDTLEGVQAAADSALGHDPAAEQFAGDLIAQDAVLSRTDGWHPEPRAPIEQADPDNSAAVHPGGRARRALDVRPGHAAR